MLERALRTIREVHQLQQTELAAKLGISKSHLSELENGRKNVTIDLLNRYADVFDVPPSTFLSFTEALEGQSARRKERAQKLLRVLEWTLDRDDGDKASTGTKASL